MREYKTNQHYGLTFLGTSKGGELVAKDESGRILLFDTAVDADDQNYIVESGWLGFDVPSGLTELTDETIEFIDDAYTCNSPVWCVACSQFHDGEYESYPDAPFRYVHDEGHYCMECVPVEYQVKELTKASDVFKAPRVESIPDGFEEIETLFCDSSGFGAPGEPALTKEQTLAAVKRLISESGETLYAALTGVGQFQVYVSILKRGAK